MSAAFQDAHRAWPCRLARAIALGLLLGAPARAHASDVTPSALCAVVATEADDARASALAALSRLPRAELTQALEALAGAPSDDATRAGALHVLGELGGPQDVRLLGRLALQPGARAAAPALRRIYADSLAALVRRHPEALWNVAEAYASAPDGSCGHVVGVVLGARSGVRAVVLASMLGARPEADAQVLTALERVARVEAVPSAVVERVRSRLSPGDARIRQAAALVLGAVRDARVVPELIDLLDEPGGFPRSGSEQALREITGLAQDSPDAWRRWYEGEETWWRSAAPGELDELASATPERTAEVLLGLARRRLHRDEIARAVGACLARAEPDLVVLACAVLHSLGSSAARADLVRALEHGEPSVRAAARTALSAIAVAEPFAAAGSRDDG